MLTDLEHIGDYDSKGLIVGTYKLGTLTSATTTDKRYPMVSAKKMNELYAATREGGINDAKNTVTSFKNAMSKNTVGDDF